MKLKRLCLAFFMFFSPGLQPLPAMVKHHTSPWAQPILETLLEDLEGLEDAVLSMETKDSERVREVGLRLTDIKTELKLSAAYPELKKSLKPRLTELGDAFLLYRDSIEFLEKVNALEFATKSKLFKGSQLKKAKKLANRDIRDSARILDAKVAAWDQAKKKNGDGLSYLLPIVENTDPIDRQQEIGAVLRTVESQIQDIQGKRWNAKSIEGVNGIHSLRKSLRWFLRSVSLMEDFFYAKINQCRGGGGLSDGVDHPEYLLPDTDNSEVCELPYCHLLRLVEFEQRLSVIKDAGEFEYRLKALMKRAVGSKSFSKKTWTREYRKLQSINQLPEWRKLGKEAIKEITSSTSVSTLDEEVSSCLNRLENS